MGCARIGYTLSLLLVLPPTGIWGQTSLDSTALAVQRLTTQFDPAPALRPLRAPAVWALTRLFYAGRSYQPAWTKDGDSRRIATLLDRLDALEDLGTEPAARRIRSMAPGPASPERIALRDVAATMAWLRTGMALSVGRVPPAAVDTLWAPASSHLDLVNRLRVALDSDRIATAFDSLAPPQADAVRLRQALARYQTIAASGGWPVLPRGPALALSAIGQRVAVLRRRLEISGDLLTGGTDTVFDLLLDSVVRLAQRRHGLIVDGVVGAATQAALNVPVRSRVLQLEVNLERWRWLPRSLGVRYILVNSAGFTLEVVDTGAMVFRTRVVAGRQDWPTPIVRGVLTDVTLHPAWNIPHEIAVREILPAIRRDTLFLAREGIHVLSDTTAEAVELDGRAIAWDSVSADAFPYRLWQQSGPRNPLGRLRFEFANRFGIALHDTPNPELFEAMSRAFSHGCVRVADAEAFADLVLRDLPEWSAESLRAALADTVERHLVLPDPIPVYVDYWTAWVDDDGTVEFRPDVYGWDAKLAAALRRRAYRQ
jgi:murein L,D-transpeptidase YcbB/YkuD